MSTPEGRLSQAIQAHLKARGAWHVKATGVALAGCPDVLCSYRGVFVALEVKTRLGHVTPRQQAQLRLIQRAGGVAVVVRSVEDVRRVLDGVDRALLAGAVRGAAYLEQRAS